MFFNIYNFSILTSVDIFFSFKRFVLLLFIIFVIIAIFSFYNYKDIFKNIYYGSIVGSFIFYLFNLLIFFYWMGYIKTNFNYINIEPHTISYIIPRLSGFTSDVNRGGFIIIFYTYFIFKNKLNFFNYFLIILNTLFLFATLSRTSFLFFVVSFCLYIYLYKSKKFKFFIILITLFFTFGSVAVINHYSKLNIIDIESVVDERLSFEDKGHDSSSSIHMKLIKDAIDELDSSFKILLFGNGHGTSYDTIKGYRMSKDKNANYHSQYLSIFVENGFFAFIAFVFLTIIIPFYNNRNIFFPLIIGSIAFNLFYQLLNEPIYWLIIFLFYYTHFNLSKNFIKNENIH